MFCSGYRKIRIVMKTLYCVRCNQMKNSAVVKLVILQQAQTVLARKVI